MKNVSSTIAMRLAHKIAKQYPKASFGACLKYSWKLVRINITAAQRILFGTYKFTFEKRRHQIWGNVSVMVIKAKGIKASIKRFLSGANADMIVTRYSFA